MNTVKRILPLLLAALILTPVSSCGNKVENTESTQNPIAAPVPEQEQTAETEPETLEADLLPDADYEGYTFNILSTDPGMLWGYMVSLYAEEETGEPLNDFVFRRNTAIEDRYNIKIANSAELDSGPTSSLALSTVRSGDDLYSIVSYGVKWQLVDAQSGSFVNLHKVNSVDFAHPWWNREAADLLTIKNRLYVAFGEFNTFDNEALGVIYVNNNMVRDNNLDSPYDLVRSGEWTLDKLYEQASSVVRDIDGDGVVSEGDVFGFIGGIGTYNMMFTATNQPHVLLGEDGSYILNQGTEGSLAAAEKIWRIVDDTTVSAFQNTQGWSPAAFRAGNVLFFNAGLAGISQYRDIEWDVGLVPIPKFDTEQEKYRSMYSNQSMTIAIPVTNSDPERTGVIAEALGAYSRIPLREVYFDTMLKVKAARDEDTAEMLDILVSNKCIDVGVLNENAWGSVISSYFNVLHEKGIGELSSTVASNRKMFSKNVEKIEQKYEELD